MRTKQRPPATRRQPKQSAGSQSQLLPEPAEVILSTWQDPRDISRLSHPTAHPLRRTALFRFQRSYGNARVQRFLATSTVPTIQKKKEPPDKLLAKFREFGKEVPELREVCEKGTNDEVKSKIDQIISSFPDRVLKKQIGESLYNRVDFIVETSEFFGSFDAMVAHYMKIRKADVPGDVHLHEDTIARIEMVAEEMRKKQLPMPETTVALGLRGKYHEKKFGAHGLGYAIDYRAETNPQIEDLRLRALVKLHIGEEMSHYAQFRDKKDRVMGWTARRQLLKKMGEESAGGGFDPASWEEAESYLKQLEEEYTRIAEQSQGLGAYVTEDMKAARKVWLQAQGAEAEHKELMENLEGQQSKLANANKKLEEYETEATKLSLKGEGIPEKLKKKIDKYQQNVQNLTDEIMGIQIKLNQASDVVAQAVEIEEDLPIIFEPWLALVEDAMAEVEAEAAGFLIDYHDEKGERIQIHGTELLEYSSEELDALAKQVSRAKKRYDREKKPEEEKKEETKERKKGVTTGPRYEPTFPNIDRDFRPLWKWYNESLVPLADTFYDDPAFLFKGKKDVGDPAAVRLMDVGYFTLDEDEEILADRPENPEQLDESIHGFNIEFMKTMAMYGFEQGINWGSTDAMHFELVEGIDKLKADYKSRH